MKKPSLHRGALIAVLISAAFPFAAAHAQSAAPGTVNAICSTDQP